MSYCPCCQVWRAGSAVLTARLVKSWITALDYQMFFHGSEKNGSYGCPSSGRLDIDSEGSRMSLSAILWTRPDGPPLRKMVSAFVDLGVPGCLPGQAADKLRPPSVTLLPNRMLRLSMSEEQGDGWKSCAPGRQSTGQPKRVAPAAGWSMVQL